MGLASGGLLALLPAALADLHPDQRGQAFAELNLAASLGMLAATSAVAAVASAGLPWRLALALPLALSAAVFLAGRRVRFAEPATPAGGPAEGRVPPVVWLCWLLVFLGVSIEWSLGFWSAQFLGLRLGIASSAAAAASGVLFAGAILGRIAMARLVRRFPCLGVLLGALALATFSLPVLWLSPAAWLSLPALALSGAAAGMFYPMGLAVAVETAPAAADAISARFSQAIGAAMLAAPLTLGLLAERVGLVAAFGVSLPIVAGMLLLAGSLALGPLRPRLARPAVLAS
jgi:MFS family permease